MHSDEGAIDPDDFAICCELFRNVDTNLITCGDRRKYSSLDPLGGDIRNPAYLSGPTEFERGHSQDRGGSPFGSATL
jgi:hypothetical protein